jgi:DNA-binding response OmpR family regulator
MQTEFTFDTQLCSSNKDFCYLGLFLSLPRRQLEYCGTRVKLSRSQFDLMHLLIMTPDVHHDVQSIEKNLRLDPSEHTVRSLIKRLRKTLKAAGAPGDKIIVSKYGVGYRLWNLTDLEEEV